MGNIVYIGPFNSGKTTRLLHWIARREERIKIFLICDPAFQHPDKSLGIAVCKKYSNAAVLLTDPLCRMETILKKAASPEGWPLFIVCDLSRFVELSHNISDPAERKKVRSFYQVDFFVILLQFLHFVSIAGLTSAVITDEVEWDARSIYILDRLNKNNCVCAAAIHPPVFERDQTIYKYFTTSFLKTIW